MIGYVEDSGTFIAFRDVNRPGRPTGVYGQARSGQTFFLNREGLCFFRSLFSLKCQAESHSKSLLGLLGRPI
jgi:hypothetical protein